MFLQPIDIKCPYCNDEEVEVFEIDPSDEIAEASSHAQCMHCKKGFAVIYYAYVTRWNNDVTNESEEKYADVDRQFFDHYKEHMSEECKKELQALMTLEKV